MREQIFKIRHDCKTKFCISTEFLAEAIHYYSVRQIKATITEITETEPERCKWTRHNGFWFTLCDKNIRESKINVTGMGAVKDCPYCGKPIEVRDGK